MLSSSGYSFYEGSKQHLSKSKIKLLMNDIDYRVLRFWLKPMTFCFIKNGLKPAPIEFCIADKNYSIFFNTFSNVLIFLLVI